MTAPKLVATYFTLAGDILPLAGNMASPIGLPERIDVAARTGWAGIGLGADDLVQSVERHGFSGIRRMLADAGLAYLEFEVLLDWFAEGEARARSDVTRRMLLEAAEKLGAHQIKIGGDLLGNVWPLERMIAEFQALCTQAAEVGTQISIEIFPESSIRDLPTAIAIAEGAGAANGGLLLDIWHLTRGKIPFEDIATIPPRYIKHIELDDADAVQVGTIFEDTIRRRKLPGEGDFDIPGFLGAVQATGYDGFYGVEILSDAHRLLPLDEASTRSFEATLKQFEKFENTRGPL